MSQIEYGPFDSSIHHADGTHRKTAPSTVTEEMADWHARRDAHVAQHVAEAREANADLSGRDEVLLRDLADQVAEVTEGRVFLLFKTMRSGRVGYEFCGIGGRLSRDDAIKDLSRILATPQGGL